MAQTISESIAYQTQIHKAWDGTEQRAALRKYPRRSVAYDYYGMTATQSQYLRALSYSKQNEKIEFPLWHAACPLNDKAYAAHSYIYINPTYLWAFNGCSGVLFWKNDILGGDRYYIRALNADGSIGLTEILEKEYAKSNTILCPVAYGYLKPEDDYTVLTASNTSMQLNVELFVEYESLPIPIALNENHLEIWEFTTPFQKVIPAYYNGISLFPIAPSWTKDLPATFSRNVNELDNATGIVKYDVKSLSSSETKEIDYILSSRSEINNFQRFFMQCKGRLKSFYAPTWLNDLVLVRDAMVGEMYLTTEWSLFWKYYATMARRKVIIVFMKSGEVRILAIAGYSVDSDSNGKVYLDATLGKSLIKSDVLMISFLCRYRFDSDTLTMDYDTTGVATTTVTLSEVDA